MKKRKRFLTGAVLLLLIIGITGCGFQKKQENLTVGMQAIGAYDYETALSCFERALENGEDAQLSYRGQGLAYMGLVQYEDAITAFLKAISYNKTGPDSISYDMNYYLASAYEKTGQYKKAIQIYSAITALKPKDAQAFYLKGCVELMDGQHDVALEDFNQTILLDNKNYDRYIAVFESLDSSGYTEEGETILRDLLEANQSSLSNYEKGRISYYLKDYDNARNELEEARTADARNADVILLLGKTYEELGDYNYASSVYNDYLGKDNTNAVIYNQLGLCRIQMKDYQSALEAFQKALTVENSGMEQTLSYNEIVAYEFLGEYKQAAVSMANYLAAYPDDEKAKREYEFLKTR